MVIVQFESWEAVERADEIIAVEGVDMVLIGTNDLLASLGLPASSSTTRCARPMHAPSRPPASMASTRASAASSRPKLAAEFVKMGAHYVSTGTDIGFLLAEATRQAKQVQDMAR